MPERPSTPNTGKSDVRGPSIGLDIDWFRLIVDTLFKLMIAGALILAGITMGWWAMALAAMFIIGVPVCQYLELKAKGNYEEH